MKHLPAVILAALAPWTFASAAEVDLQDAFPSLPSFNYPTNLQDPLDGTDRLFIMEQAGRIWVFANDPAVNTRTLFLDITAQVNSTWECGLLGLAFDPDYENNGTFYIYYVTSDPLRSRLSRFQVSANPNVADAASEQPILEIPQMNFCHKSGCLAFGADGYLYLTVGEDCQGFPAQDRTSLKGKMLRLDVHVEAPGTYAIPPDNPFVGNPNGWREEIWAYGFRNAWRFSIDPETQRIWLGDVGEANWEEVNIIEKGRNYGWIKMEGEACYPNPGVCDTMGTNIVLPIYAYPHGSEFGESVTGGYVYRGPTAPGLWGKYVYADYPTGTMWALSYDGENVAIDEIYPSDPPTRYMSTFGVDNSNELYIVTLFGRIYRLIDITVAVDTPALPQPTLTAGPNPFHSSSTFRFEVPADAIARVELYDVKGSRVRVLKPKPGANAVTWRGRDDSGRNLASGVYFARLIVDGRPMAHQRVVLVR